MIRSRKMRWEGHVAQMGERRNMYRLLVGKPEGKKRLGRPKRRWVANIKKCLGVIGDRMGVLTGLFWLQIGTSGKLL
jgi:hypothetical protein